MVGGATAAGLQSPPLARLLEEDHLHQREIEGPVGLVAKSVYQGGIAAFFPKLQAGWKECLG